MSGLIACISAFFSAFSRHRDLALENLALRQQLAIFKCPTLARVSVRRIASFESGSQKFGPVGGRRCKRAAENVEK